MSKRKATKKAAKKAPAKSKKKAKPPSAAEPPVAQKTEAPRWGASKVVGSIGNRQVTIREPLNQAAIDSLTEQEAMGLVLAVLVGRLEDNMAEVGRLMGSLKGWAGNEALLAGSSS